MRLLDLVDTAIDTVHSNRLLYSSCNYTVYMADARTDTKLIARRAAHTHPDVNRTTAIHAEFV